MSFNLLYILGTLSAWFDRIMNICRECGLQSSAASADDSDICAVCLERGCSVAAEGLFLCSFLIP